MWKCGNSEIYTLAFISVLTTSNFLSAKLITVGPLLIPGGVVCYAITYLIIDVIGELYGKRRAKNVVQYGFICQVLSTGMLLVVRALPATDQTGAAFDVVFSSNAGLAAASFAAYLVSQAADVALFHGIRDKTLSQGKKCKWLYNNVSTITSQIIDTVVYVGLGFGLGLGLPINLLTRMAVSQIMVKAVLAVADTPLFYLLTRKRRA